MLASKLASTRKGEHTQIMYNNLCKAIFNTPVIAGKKKHITTTDDKLSNYTKFLIEKRAALKRIVEKSTKEKIELIEINKLIKREIRMDVRICDEKVIERTLIETGSIKKAKRAINLSKY